MEINDSADGIRLISETRLSIGRYLNKITIRDETSKRSQETSEDDKVLSARRKRIVERNTFWPPSATHICKFKDKCFRTKPSHFERFSHPLTHEFVKHALSQTSDSTKRSPSLLQSASEEDKSEAESTKSEDFTSPSEHADRFSRFKDQFPPSPRAPATCEPMGTLESTAVAMKKGWNTPSSQRKTLTSSSSPFQSLSRSGQMFSSSPETTESKYEMTSLLKSPTFYQEQRNAPETTHISLGGTLPQMNTSRRPTLSQSTGSAVRSTTNSYLSDMDKSEPSVFNLNVQHEEDIDQMDESQLRTLIRKMRDPQRMYMSDSAAMRPTEGQAVSRYAPQESITIPSYSTDSHLTEIIGSTLRDPGFEEETIEEEEAEMVVNWTRGFQHATQAIRALSPNTRQEKRIEVYHDLSTHGHNFIYTAKTYGKIIISEVYMEPNKKTIPPLKGKGFAGGDKYYVHGIYFKFAVDSEHLYGGDEGAMKVAGHELRHLITVFNCWIKEFTVPMTILLDYRGFRLIAMSTFPVTDSTITYGCSDASKGGSVHADPKTEKLVQRLATDLNLKAHRVGPDSTLLWTCIDLEVHMGLDDKLYLLDFSRLFPPVEPNRKIPCSYLVNLFRPEFVQKFKKSLCSDAFSPFLNDPDSEIHNQEIREATKILKETNIPEFAEILLKIPMEERDSFPLTPSLHAHGINVRYLGLIRAALPKEEFYWRIVLFIEMASRCIKQLIRSKLRLKIRELRQPGDDAYKRVVIDQFNLIFSETAQSRTHWKTVLKDLLLSKFENSLDDDELNINLKTLLPCTKHAFRLKDGRCILFKKISKNLGLVFTEATQRSCLENPNFFEFQQPFDETDLEDIQERIKHMNIVSHSEGFVLKMKASKKFKDESLRLYHLAIDKFKKALESNPNNRNSLRNLADCYTYLDQKSEAEFYYKEAIKSDPHDTNSLYKYGAFLDKYDRSDQAEEFYLQSLEADPTHSNCLGVYADFLACSRNLYHEAEELYNCAIRLDKKNPFLLNNFGCLMILMNKFQEAENYIKEAISCDNSGDNPAIFRNLAVLYEIRGNSADSRHYLDLYKLKKKYLNSMSLSGVIYQS
eukprot:TRINITY_DN6964_c0_g1_i1.p1 TRINITY_DN6964_c0_g1~~TRINITY_DN6964_c0_g1_i1.p1  ORF type:complete len:1087 (+),score=286.12 TRINITY_DN6964_c0_g1_i1:199-3459(+)